jgi:biopolymer transport protein TolR
VARQTTITPQTLKPGNISRNFGVKADVEVPMSMTSASSKEPRAEINVTPLIDVLLVLLIIFMVIQPIAVRGLDTLVPQPPKSPKQAEQPKAIVVQVLGDREHGVTYKINQTSLNKLDIQPRLSQIFATRTDKSIFIQGDATLDFSLVADVIDYGHQAGVVNIGLITQRATGLQPTK